MKFITKVKELNWDNHELQFHKYVPLSKIEKLNDENLLYILSLMKEYCTFNYKKILVDYKIRFCKEGTTGCPNPDFHYDCVRYYDHPSKHENHLIYTNLDGTLFYNEGDIIKVGDSEIWQYSRELHSTPIMSKSIKRVLIRLTETDNVNYPTTLKGHSGFTP